MERIGDENAPSGTGGTAPSLIVVCGLPGVGKSRVARELGDLLSAPVYRTDEVRADRYGEPTYSSAETEDVYAELLDRAVATVGNGTRAVLDGTYRCESFRADVVEAADRLDVDCVFVKVACSEGVVRERITSRTDDASDAGLEEYYLLGEEFDPLLRGHVTIDNSGDWSSTREQVRAAFSGEG